MPQIYSECSGPLNFLEAVPILRIQITTNGFRTNNYLLRNTALSLDYNTVHKHFDLPFLCG
jgi:hypothetical protein